MSKIAGLSRRQLLLSSSIVSAGVLLAGAASSAPTPAPQSTVTSTQAGEVVGNVEFCDLLLCPATIVAAYPADERYVSQCA
jgi:hypothetical protein